MAMMWCHDSCSNEALWPEPWGVGWFGGNFLYVNSRYALVPGTIAFTDAHIEVDITYAEYFEMSVRLAEAMKRYGLNTNHRIVVCSENSLQFFMPVLGALFIGVAVAPANDIYNERELLNSMGISPIH